MNTNIQKLACPPLGMTGGSALIAIFHLCLLSLSLLSQPLVVSASDFVDSLSSHPGFVCPKGFILEAVADDKWVHDAFAITTDSRGNLVVSGPGYIRTLTDLDSSGRFTRAIDLKATITHGAQGLWCEAGKYYFVADGGLWAVDDANGDCVADSPRKKVFDLPTGGEHDAHAIRRGPDGWWYLIAGNFAATIGKLKNDPDSPVPQPRAGTLWRISPDFSQRGVWAHGLRNAYDFDFLADGSIVTYDSDEERELTLPWYRQTRVSVLSAGSDAGWVNTAWSDLASRTTMPHTLSRLGRGSPTGVKVYDHTAFPEKYHNAIFVEDWTFGRILAIYPQPKDVSDANQVPERLMAETFVQTTGNVGFAPTDITVAPDGSLLICSGGRGTTGSLYRIRYAPSGSGMGGSSVALRNATQTLAPLTEKLESNDAIASCLSAPSPLEAWSRAQWEPIWQRASQESRINAISNPAASNPAAYSLQRRAIQCEVDLQNRGVIPSAQRVPVAEFQKLCLSPAVVNAKQTFSAIDVVPPASTRQTAWWALGHLSIPAAEFNTWMQQSSSTNPSQWMRWFDSNDSTQFEAMIGDSVIRAFYECVGLRRGALPTQSIWDAHRTSVSDNHSRSAETQRSLRQIQLWAASRANADVAKNPGSNSSVMLETRDFDTLVGIRLFGPNLNTIDASLLDQLAQRCSKKLIPNTFPEVLEALAVLQASLGDYRFAVPAHQSPPTTEVIDGYRCLYSSKMPADIREGWAKWCTIIAGSQSSTGSQTSEAWKAIVVPETLRALAMLAPESPEAVSFCLEQITPTSHPTSDIHALITLSCCTAPRTGEQTLATGDALSGVLGKVNSLGLNTESKWAARLEEVWKKLIAKDSQLPNMFTSRETFGSRDDLFWLKLCPQQVQAVGKSRFKQALLRTPTHDWDANVARFVWSNPKDVTSELYDYLRQQAKAQSEPPPALVIELLSNNPSKIDYQFFLSAIESTDRAYLPSAWNGLSLLPVEDPPREMVAIAMLWNRQNVTNLTAVTPGAIVKRIRMVAAKAERNAKKPILPSSDAWNDWEPYLKKVLGNKYQDQKTVQGDADGSTSKEWQERVKDMDKLVGHVDRGRLLYQASKCASCHGGENANTSNALGPSLTGVAKRFSSEDLFRAIFEPSRDISDRYRATKVLTTDGAILVGMKIYDSVDGITLQLADGTVARINQADIEEKATADQSLMPAGLIDSQSISELADLYAYLKSL